MRWGGDRYLEVTARVILGKNAKGATVADQLGYTNRGAAHNVVAKALREQTAEAVGSLRFLENARLDTLQVALWDAAMAGDVRAVMACVQIVQARVRLNGLEPARDGFGGASGPRTLVVPQGV